MEKSHPKEQLLGHRVVLKKHDISLSTTMFEHIQRDRERLRRFLPWVDYTRSIDDERSYIRMALEWWSDHTLFDFGVFLRDNGAYIGNVSAHTISWPNRRCEIGYWLTSSAEGHGYVSDALATLEAELFRMGFNRLEIRCSAKNEKSAAVPRRNGYRLEAEFREDTLENGEMRDTLVFAKLHADQLAKASREPSIFGIDHVLALVPNHREAGQWYARVFRARPIAETEISCEFRIGSNILVLCSSEQRASQHLNQIVYWRVDDVSTAVSRLKEEGARIATEIVTLKDGTKMCQLIDPFGHSFGLRGR